MRFRNIAELGGQTGWRACRHDPVGSHVRLRANASRGGHQRQTDAIVSRHQDRNIIASAGKLGGRLWQRPKNFIP
jgi:hypothetical protein